MRSFIKIALEVFASLGGIGGASIGALPGIQKDGHNYSKKQQLEEQVQWLPWGGSHLEINEVKASQDAFEHGRWKEALESLEAVYVEHQSSAFYAQLLNNKAVAAYKLSGQVIGEEKANLLNKAEEWIIEAIKRAPSNIEELLDTLEHNLRLIRRGKNYA